MNILHINTSDRGGAGTACLRIHKELLNKGINSKVLVLDKRNSEEEVYQYNYFENLKSTFEGYVKRYKYAKYQREVKKKYEELPLNSVQFSFPTSLFDITEHTLYKEADLIQLNWVSSFLDEPSFFAKNTKPVVWRMSDLYVCGGGNHYEKNFPFEAFKVYTEKNIAIRKKALEGRNISLVPISNWAKLKAKSSNLVCEFDMTLIHNGLDTTLFRQYDRNFCRDLWGLPKDKKVILFGADAVRDPRKGIQLLLEALNIVNDKNLFICAFGRDGIVSDKIHMLGLVKDERLLATLYSAADLFIMPSIEETFGQVIIEALACGTPVVSFPSGGGLDTIINNLNGLLANDFTSISLAESINNALGTNFNRDTISDDSHKRFNIEDKADEYINLYKSILDK